jgi:hypothetical protein
MGANITVVTTGATTTPDFFSSQLFGGIVGSILTALLSFLLNLHLNRQQNLRDSRAHERQIARENEAYVRTIKAAKRERLRSAFKVLLNAADIYQVEAQQMNHVPDPSNISLTGIDEVVNDVTLEGVEADVLPIFFDIRGAFNELSARWSMPEEGEWKDVLKQKSKVIAKVEELKSAMNKHLEGLEQ